MRPATTARMVANATAAITASRIVPPTSPKTTADALGELRRGGVAAALTPGVASLPTSAAAPKPSDQGEQVEDADEADAPR